MAATAGGPTLLGSGTASASENTSTASGAVSHTGWSSVDAILPIWWQYDFGRPVTVAELRITSGYNSYGLTGPATFNFQYSDDGATWTTSESLTPAPWFTWPSSTPQVFAVPVPAPVIVPSIGIDYPLGIIESREDYSRIALKSLSTFPAALFYDSAWPTGSVYIWPIPPAGRFEIHLLTKAALPVYANLTDPINLPPEYMEAAIYSLAVRFAMNYGQDPRPAQVMAMRAALNTIRLANTQIGLLAMPAELGPRRHGGIAAGSDPSFQTGSW
jgi:hypothetical protein